MAAISENSALHTVEQGLVLLVSATANRSFRDASCSTGGDDCSFNRTATNRRAAGRRVPTTGAAHPLAFDREFRSCSAGVHDCRPRSSQGPPQLNRRTARRHRRRFRPHPRCRRQGQPTHRVPVQDGPAPKERSWRQAVRSGRQPPRPLLRLANQLRQTRLGTARVHGSGHQGPNLASSA